MSLAARPYAGDADLSLIAELIQNVPPMGRHLVDFPWRLGAPTLDPLLDARVWTVDGVAVGFAAWRIWWAVLDVYVRPDPSQPEVEAAIFEWAPQRFRELDAERGQLLPYWVEARADDPERPNGVWPKSSPSASIPAFRARGWGGPFRGRYWGASRLMAPNTRKWRPRATGHPPSTPTKRPAYSRSTGRCVKASGSRGAMTNQTGKARSGELPTVDGW